MNRQQPRIGSASRRGRVGSPRGLAVAVMVVAAFVVVCLSALATRADEKANGADRGANAGASSVKPANDAATLEGNRLFVRTIKPLLAEKCMACHGADEKKIKGKYDMRTRAGLLAGGESKKAAVVPGKPDASPMLIAVTWTDPFLEMPPKENDRLSAEQIASLRRWIELGAPWPDEATQKKLLEDDWNRGVANGVRVATSGGLSDDWTNRLYDPADLWAYQPVRKPKVPWDALKAQPRGDGDASHERNADNDHSSRNPIDAFIARKLNEANLTAAPQAGRATLIRRLTFDLTGLPPTPAEVEAFVNDDSPIAYDKLVDRLLASPHYGERMAQHWLDVVRYADTAGYANDYERPHAWRYRDYVIRAFNRDKPFDQFILEQIAGDEMAVELDEAGASDPSPLRGRLGGGDERRGAQSETNNNNENRTGNHPPPAPPSREEGESTTPGEQVKTERKVAVGFLRMGPWEHTAMSVAAVTRQLWLDDVTNSVGESFLGHALRCASCHDHKFDPIPTRDYYRIQAAFASTQFAEVEAPFLPSENVANASARNAETKQQMSEAALGQVTNLEIDNAFSRIKKKLGAFRKLALERFEPVTLSVKTDNPQKVAILTGGSLERPGEAVEPGVLSALLKAKDEGVIPKSKDGRRLALAKWIADRDNPLTARVFVNRVWQWHFGRGIVATPNNFGKTGSKPTHPELLDYLAATFIEEGWSTKKLHRLIVTSEAYKRSSSHPDATNSKSVDPDNKLLARFSPRRLTAEELRDAMLATTGELVTEMGGPGVFPVINWEVALQPRHIMGGIAPPYRPSLSREQRNRRTIYAFRYRGLSYPMLEVFNRPNSDVSCERRDATTVTPQAFELFNGAFAHDRALALAARIAKEADDVEQQVTQAFALVHAREPSPREREIAVAHVAKMRAHHRGFEPEKKPMPSVVEREMIAEQTGARFQWTEKLMLDGFEPDLKRWDAAPDTRALAELCLVLLNSSEFLYVY